MLKLDFRSRYRYRYRYRYLFRLRWFRPALTLAMSLGLAVGLGLGLASPSAALGAPRASTIKLDGEGTRKAVPQARPQARAQARASFLDNIAKGITGNPLIKDLGHLFQFRSGKFVNWNRQSFDALKRDLRLAPPRNVAAAAQGAHGNAKAPANAAAAGKKRTAAQMLDGQGGSGTPRPAPVPEPSTLAVFGLAGAWALGRRGRRWWGRGRRRPESLKWARRGGRKTSEELTSIQPGTGGHARPPYHGGPGCSSTRGNRSARGAMAWGWSRRCR